MFAMSNNASSSREETPRHTVTFRPVLVQAET